MTSWKTSQIKVTLGSLSPSTPVAPPLAAPRADPQAFAEIRAAVEARDFDRAGRLAEAALAAGAEHPMLLNLAALRCEQAERFDEAVALLERAVALAPKDPGARNALGLTLLRLERYGEALAQFDRAVEAAPDFAGAHSARGSALEALGRLTAADAAFRRAIELAPENLAALAGLANLSSRRGAHPEARDLAMRVLAAQPGFPTAVNAVAAADLAQGDAPAAEQRLEAAIADPRLSPQDRAYAQGLLGDALDAQGRVDEAFSAYSACNMGLWRAYAKPYGAKPGALEFAQGMIARLDEIPAERWRGKGAGLPEGAPAPDGVRDHVFLLGFPRSGTTLLEQVLASHGEVEALEERETLADAMRAFLTTPDDLPRLAEAGEAALAPLRAAYWSRVRDEGGRAWAARCSSTSIP